MKPNTVGDEHRRYFAERVKHWQAALGLLDWRVTVSSVPTKRNMAEVYKCDLIARLATIRLGTDFGPTTEVTLATLDSTALHEVLHVFLYEYQQACKSTTATTDDQMAAEHRIVNVLEKLLTREGQNAAAAP